MPKETFMNLSEEKQDRIMRSAISEFSMHGYEKANIGKMAKKAEVAKGSMYQYFENKREIFLFSVQWSISLLMKKYNREIVNKDKILNIFDYFYENSKNMWTQMMDEREIILFIEDVFLGKYKDLTDESMAYMMKYSDEALLQLIRDGKESGHIRKDIDDCMLSLFMTGVSLKIKEYLINRARVAGEEIIDSDFSCIENEVKTMIELLKNGMATKN